MASKSPLKSRSWSGSSSASAARRPSLSRAMIIARILGWRSSAMNMCSVRHSPIPSAPELPGAPRVAGRVGVGAHAAAARSSSAHARTCSKSRSIVGSSKRRARLDDCPVAAVDRRSRRRPGTPGRRSAARRRPRRSTTGAPVTAGTPIPRATSAACEALPPSEVRIPFATWKPATSSASVNGRTRIDVGALGGRLDRLGGGEHDLAGGRSGRGGHAVGQHRVTLAAVEGRMQQRLERPGVDRRQRLLSVRSPSLTASTAKRTAACAGRLALRVWSMYSRPSSIVNSTSCMSL